MSWSLDTVSWFQSVILWLAIVPCGWEKLHTGFLGSIPYQCSPCMYEELLVPRLEAIHPNSFGQIVSLKLMLLVPYSRHRYCSIWSSIPFGISSVRPNLEKRPPRIWSSDCNKASKRFEVTCLQMTLIMYVLSVPLKKCQPISASEQASLIQNYHKWIFFHLFSEEIVDLCSD